MSATAKAEVLEKVAASQAPIRQMLRQMGVPKSTYYRWCARTTPPDVHPVGSHGTDLQK